MDPIRIFERDLIAKNRAKSTRDLYLLTARRFIDYLGETELEEAEANDFLGYLQERENAGLKVWRRELSHLRQFLLALVEAGLLEESPADDLHLQQRRPVMKKALTLDAIHDLLDMALKPEAEEGSVIWALRLRDRAALELLYALGVRNSEVCRIKITDINIASGSVRVRPVKRGKPRSLPLPIRSRDALRRYQQRGRALLALQRRDQGVFLLSRTGRPLCRSGLWWAVASVARRAGLHAYPHAIRRSVATHMIRNGASVRAVQHLLGHRSLGATDAYLAVDMADLRAAVTLLER